MRVRAARPRWPLTGWQLRWLAPLVALLVQTAAWGQGSALRLEPSPESLACLKTASPGPRLQAYPGSMAKGASKVVRVSLTYVAPDAPPVSQVTYNNGDETLAALVSDQVDSNRLPCLKPGTHLTFVQEFQFVGQTMSVLASPQRVEPDRRFDWDSDCLAGIRNVPPPVYPAGNRISGRAPPGTVVVRLRFTAADKPPEAVVLFDGGSRRLAAAVEANVGQYRLGCFEPGEKPMVAEQTFSFKYEGEEPPRLKEEIDFSQFLGSIRDLEREKVRFDFSTMGCPFRVRFRPFQPYARNRVEWLDGTDQVRREFFEWLQGVVANVPPKLMSTVIGTPTTFLVPCAVLNLT